MSPFKIGQSQAKRLFEKSVLTQMWHPYPGPNSSRRTLLKANYSIFKRGMKGVYQHCKEKHLHRYLSEFDFRYSNRVKLGVDDVARADRALLGAKGKRLTYRTTSH
jgi:hypothetical protein